MAASRKFNCDDDPRELGDLSPWLLVVLADVVLWATPKRLPVTITSIVRKTDDGISASSTHQSGRAFDLSVKGWSQTSIGLLAKYINDKYAANLGTSGNGKNPIVCLYHNNGNGWHFHFQVKRYIDEKRAILIS